MREAIDGFHALLQIFELIRYFGKLVRREVKGCGNMRTNSVQKELKDGR